MKNAEKRSEDLVSKEHVKANSEVAVAKISDILGPKKSGLICNSCRLDRLIETFPGDQDVFFELFDYLLETPHDHGNHGIIKDFCHKAKLNALAVEKFIEFNQIQCDCDLIAMIYAGLASDGKHE